MGAVMEAVAGTAEELGRQFTGREMAHRVDAPERRVYAAMGNLVRQGRLDQRPTTDRQLADDAAYDALADLYDHLNATDGWYGRERLCLAWRDAYAEAVEAWDDGAYDTLAADGALHHRGNGVVEITAEGWTKLFDAHDAAPRVYRFTDGVGSPGLGHIDQRPRAVAGDA